MEYDEGGIKEKYIIFILIIKSVPKTRFQRLCYPARVRSARARRACTLRALGLLLHPAPDRAASRSSILNVAFFGIMTQLRGTPLTQRHLFWLEEFLFSSEALNFRVPLS